MTRLLVRGIDLQQHDVFRVVPPHDRLTQQRVVFVRVQTRRAARSSSRRFRTPRGTIPPAGAGTRTRSGSPESPPSCGRSSASSPKSACTNKGHGVFAGNVVLRRNRRARIALIPRVGEQLLHHLAPVARHGVDQAARQEARRFAVAKGHGLAAALLEQGQKARVLRLRKILVKAPAMGGNQAGMLRRA